MCLQVVCLYASNILCMCLWDVTFILVVGACVWMPLLIRLRVRLGSWWLYVVLASDICGDAET